MFILKCVNNIDVIDVNENLCLNYFHFNKLGRK